INEYKAFIRFPVTVPQLKSIIGKNIKIHRKASRIRSEELADMLGIESSTLRHIERGNKNISLSVLFKLSGFLRISIDTLFHDAGKEVLPRDKSPILINELNTMIVQFDPEELEDLTVVVRQFLNLKNKLKKA
ncbi:MAG: helix-turn-helix domain-containing protein, partial [Defluviitaleaceae bacterium]|nr:helix-turn-helix domain-containing protein [Defluviitaleaceae bacterium]